MQGKLILKQLYFIEMVFPLFLFAVFGCGDDEGNNQVDLSEIEQTDLTHSDLLGDAPEDLNQNDPLQEIGTADSEQDLHEVGIEPTLSTQGEWGPMARVNDLYVPDYPEQSRSKGCLLFGENVGTGLANLLLLAGGFEPYLKPNSSGEIGYVLMTEADGWEEGVSLPELNSVTMNLLYGLHGGDELFHIDPFSFESENPDGALVSSFEESDVENGWFKTTPTQIKFQLPVLADFMVVAQLDWTVMTGQLRVDGPGHGVDNGTLAGYLSRESLTDIGHQIHSTCYSDNPVSVCDLLSGYLTPEMDDEALLNLLLGFTTGFDVLIVDGIPGDCVEESECNAMGVCLVFEAEGMVVAGISGE
jgi:hypothetical protein